MEPPSDRHPRGLADRIFDGYGKMNGLIVVVNYEQEFEISRFLEGLTAHNPGLEVIIIDDGSTDSSPELAEKSGYQVLRHPINQGVGAAIRTGIKWARARSKYDYVVIMSSNGKMKSDEISRVISPIIEDRADYVQGSRFAREGRSVDLSLFRRLAIPSYSGVASLLLGQRFTDITCGFRAYRLNIFDDPSVNLDQEWLNRYEGELYIHYHACRKNLRIVEVPVTIDYSHLDARRKSKMKPIVSWWSLMRPLFLLRARLKS
jgi:glycosyltransferase involved in cell wall biosynthesis